MEYRIIDTTETQLEQIEAIEQQCFSCPWTLDQLRSQLSDDRHVFLAAVAESGAVLGYVGMHCVAGECYIDNVAVFPHARRKGVAAALLEDLVTWARAEACAFVTLEVRPSNTAAIALYKKFGFEEVGRRKRFYRDPDEDGSILTLNL